MAKLVKAGVTLRDQINKRFPKRDKASDGWIGDAAHQSRPSDHNPDKGGWVHALDVDEDFGAKGDNMRLANELRRLAQQGLDNGRIKYIVYEDRIASGTANNWAWRGSGYGHTKHIHVSFTSAAEKDGSKFPLAIFDTKAQQWDGTVPAFDELVRASTTPDDKSLASWRLACRLADLGYYQGAVKPRGEQGYPVKAVQAVQQSMHAAPTGKWGPKLHQRIFGVAP